ncbi:MAG: quinone-dependent dihydroorotate dehydrogenase [Succinivibrio sp.]|jgi:dihydroorotate dehydrogenase|nr:quinone-dependent dihydroorotate dehydrogenase [Succinivibrio sp.]
MFPYFLYRSLVRPLLFMFNAENAHDSVIRLGRVLSKEPFKTIFSQKVIESPLEVMGLKFKNPVGLAAGMDKDAEAVDFFGALGFGFIEVGTVTPRPQDGNPKPRMFRVYEAEGIINRMGFNNKGVDNLVRNLKNCKYDGVIGVSIGKNEDTPIEHAVDDYLECMEKVYPVADYIAVNVSCPNTPDLTDLQQADAFTALISPLKECQKRLAEDTGNYVPLVVKISPDLFDNELRSLCGVCLEQKIDGITCTNTTVSRDVIDGMTHANEWGGLSGQPLFHKSTRVLKLVSDMVDNSIPIIGVGGISNAVQAREKIDAGASLVQIFSSLIFDGPKVIKDIANNI